MIFSQLLYPVILIFLGILLVFGGMIFLLRNFVCWYLKINERQELQQQILEQLKSINRNLQKHELSKDRELILSPNNEKEQKFESEEDMLIQIFNGYKNIAVYNVEPDDESIFTYFQAKQYNIIPINNKNIQFADTKTYATLMSVEEKIEILLIKEGTQNITNTLNKCIARRKIKKDIEYVWFEDFIFDANMLKKLQDSNIKVINGHNMYKEYVKLIMKTTIR